MDNSPVPRDVFSNTISERERDILLDPDCPRSLLVDSISQALNNIGDTELKNKVGEKSVAKVLRGEYIPPVVQEFLDSLTSENKRLAPYMGGSEKEYLAIFCGVKDTIQLYRQTKPELADQLVQQLELQSEITLKQNPSFELGEQAVKIITGKNGEA
jgi:hypothetical protein